MLSFACVCIYLLQSTLKYTKSQSRPNIPFYWKTSDATDKVADYWNHGDIFIPGLKDVFTQTTNKPDIFPPWLTRTTSNKDKTFSEIRTLHVKNTHATEHTDKYDDRKDTIEKINSTLTIKTKNLITITTPISPHPKTTMTVKKLKEVSKITKKTTAEKKATEGSQSSIDQNTENTTIEEITQTTKKKLILKSTTITATTKNKLTKQSPLDKKELNETGEMFYTEPFSSFLIQFVKALSVKNASELPLLPALIYPFVQYVTHLLAAGKLAVLGPETEFYIRNMMEEIDLARDSLHKQFYQAYNTLSNRHVMLKDDINELLDYMDDTYVEAEEEAMQDILMETTKFPAGNLTADMVARGFVNEVFLKPMERIASTTRGNMLFKMVKEVVLKRMPPAQEAILRRGHQFPKNFLDNKYVLNRRRQLHPRVNNKKTKSNMVLNEFRKNSIIGENARKHVRQNVKSEPSSYEEENSLMIPNDENKSISIHSDLKTCDCRYTSGEVKSYENSNIKRNSYNYNESKINDLIPKNQIEKRIIAEMNPLPKSKQYKKNIAYKLFSKTKPILMVKNVERSNNFHDDYNVNIRGHQNTVERGKTNTIKVILLSTRAFTRTTKNIRNIREFDRYMKNGKKTRKISKNLNMVHDWPNTITPYNEVKPPESYKVTHAKLLKNKDYVFPFQAQNRFRQFTLELKNKTPLTRTDSLDNYESEEPIQEETRTSNEYPQHKNETEMATNSKFTDEISNATVNKTMKNTEPKNITDEEEYFDNNEEIVDFSESSDYSCDCSDYLGHEIQDKHLNKSVAKRSKHAKLGGNKYARANDKKDKKYSRKHHHKKRHKHRHGHKHWHYSKRKYEKLKRKYQRLKRLRHKIRQKAYFDDDRTSPTPSNNRIDNTVGTDSLEQFREINKNIIRAGDVENIYSYENHESKQSNKAYSHTTPVKGEKRINLFLEDYGDEKYNTSKQKIPIGQTTPSFIEKTKGVHVIPIYSVETTRYSDSIDYTDFARRSFSEKHQKITTDNSSIVSKATIYSSIEEDELKENLYDAFRHIDFLNRNGSRRFMDNSPSPDLHGESHDTDVEAVLKTNIYRAVKQLLKN